MKITGAVLFLAAGMLCGCSAAAKLDKHAASVRLLRQLVQFFISELRSVLPLTSDLLRSAASQQSFSSLQFLHAAAAHADQFPQCWGQALSADRNLHASERTVLETVGQTLGSTTLDGQIAALTLCQERLAILQEEAEQTARQKGNLYRSMGILTAVFIVIILL